MPHSVPTPVQKLTQKQVDDWRKNLRATLAIPQDKDKAATRPRAEGSINRDMTTLRAALNLALENGDVTSDHAWKAKLKPIENADGRRDVYLDQTQRRKLIDKAPADLALFLTALCLLPLRPGAVAALNGTTEMRCAGAVGVLMGGSEVLRGRGDAAQTRERAVSQVCSVAATGAKLPDRAASRPCWRVSPSITSRCRRPARSGARAW